MRKNGFTIVELLIVVVIIGILAAIVVVAYNGITNRANDSAVESDLATLAKKVEIYKVENGVYPASSALLDTMDAKMTKSAYMRDRNNLYYCIRTDSSEYAVGAQSVSGSNYFLLNGTVSSSGGVSGAATCAQIDADTNQTSWVSTGVNSSNVWTAWTD